MLSGDIYLGQQWLLAAPTHYLNQCWLIISEVLWHSHDGNFIENAQHISPWYDLLLIKDYINICHITGQWVKLSKIEITCTNDARQPCWCRHNRCRAPFYQLSITSCGSLGSRLSNERDGWCLLVISVGWSTLCAEVVSQPFLDEPTRKVKVKQWCE